MMAWLRTFFDQPLSRKLQMLQFVAARLKTTLWYRLRLRRCGRANVVLRPLFWTPEFICLGSGVLIWPGARIEALQLASESQRPQIDIEDGVTIQQQCHITCGGSLRIGAGTTVLSNVVITDMDHEYRDIGRRVYDQPISVRETRIGANCFIGAGAKLLSGTRLGDSCVVGANAVVRGEFPAFCVLGGNPARVLKRFDDVSKTWLSGAAAAASVQGRAGE